MSCLRKRGLAWLTEHSHSAWRLIQDRGAKACTTKLPVELLQHVEGLGSPGDIRKVNPGYARNFLVPNKIAKIRRGKQSGSVGGVSRGMAADEITLDTDNSILLEEQRKRDEASRRKKLENVVKKLIESVIICKGKVNQEGAMEEGIGAAAIAAAVAKQLQIEIVEELLDMDGETITVPGEYLIPLKLILGDGSRASLSLRVQAN